MKFESSNRRDVVVDWLGMRGSGADLFSPLLPSIDEVDPQRHRDLRPPRSRADDPEEDPASDDDSSAEEASPPDPRDAAAAAAVRAVAQDSKRRDDPAFDAAKQRRRRLERIQDRLESVSRRVNDVSHASDDVAQRLEHLSLYDHEAADREGRATGEDEGDNDYKMASGAMSKAAIIVLIITAGIATYLATMWDSLSLVMRYFVIVTYVWLFCAAMLILVQFLVKKRIGDMDEARPDDALSVDGQSHVPVEPVGPSLL